MKKEIEQILDTKVQTYLREQFPKTRLIRYSKITDKNADIYGKNGMQIKVVKLSNNEIGYQLITNSNK